MNNSIFFDYKPMNRVEAAKNKLRMHRTMGKQSAISIFEAAQLMDMIVFENANGKSEEMIFTMSLN
jgi:hypothetical protein